MAINRPTISWAFYDWANSAFSTTIMAGFFPIFFKQYWCVNVDVSSSTLRLGLANSIGSILVIFLAPLLGAIADQACAKKKFLFIFTLLGVASSAALYFISEGNWLQAATLYVFAIIGFSCGNVFYDSLLLSISPPRQRDRISALGFSLGYLGGGILFAFNVLTTFQPKLFGLADATQAVQLSFLTVAGWWLFFSMPLFFWVKEPSVSTPTTLKKSFWTSLQQLKNTGRKITRHRQVFLFLLAYWLYIDGLATIVRMAVDYGMALGFAPENLVLALLITQFVGFPAALLFGRLGEKTGCKNAILGGIVTYLLITIWAMFMDTISEFYLMATALGLVQGGVQALSRSFYSRLIPTNKAAEFYGFYNMVGKFAAVIGPLLMGTISVISANPRLSLLGIIFLFCSGGSLLLLVDEEEGQALARRASR
jgi:UMF1 family MFS transporter